MSVVEYCILNVEASPHPPGVYVRLLSDAAGRYVNYWGDRSATISEPKAEREGFYRGRLATWNDIDFNEPGVSKQKLEEIDLSAIGENFPAEVGVNGRIFSYVLRERDHTIFVETKNESGQSLSPIQAGKIFDHLLNDGIGQGRNQFVEVTVIPEAGVLKQILSIPRLKSLHIRLVRPNPDDIGAEAQAILDELEEQNIKREDIHLTAVAGESIEPNERTKTQAWVGNFSGYVKGTGTNDDGEPTVISTREMPRILQRVLDEFTSAFASILSVARDTAVERGDRDDL